MTGGNHWVDDDAEALAHVVRQLQVVLDRLERDRVAVQADVADPCGGHEIQHAVQDSVAGAQDRDEAEFLAGEAGGQHGSRGVSIAMDVSGRSRVTS